MAAAAAVMHVNSQENGFSGRWVDVEGMVDKQQPVHRHVKDAH